MNANTARSGDSIDRNISRVLKMQLARKEESIKELILATGINKSTMTRRLSRGGWSAGEISVLADHFGISVETFYADPDAPYLGVNKSSTTPPFVGVSDAA